MGSHSSTKIPCLMEHELELEQTENAAGGQQRRSAEEVSRAGGHYSLVLNGWIVIGRERLLLVPRGYWKVPRGSVESP